MLRVIAALHRAAQEAAGARFEAEPFAQQGH